MNTRQYIEKQFRLAMPNANDVRHVWLGNSETHCVIVLGDHPQLWTMEVGSDDDDFVFTCADFPGEVVRFDFQPENEQDSDHDE